MGFERAVGRANKNHPVVPQLVAAHALVVDVKEDAVIEEVFWSATEVNSTAKETNRC